MADVKLDDLASDEIISLCKPLAMNNKAIRIFESEEQSEIPYAFENEGSFSASVAFLRRHFKKAAENYYLTMTRDRFFLLLDFRNDENLRKFYSAYRKEFRKTRKNIRKICGKIEDFAVSYCYGLAVRQGDLHESDLRALSNEDIEKMLPESYRKRANGIIGEMTGVEEYDSDEAFKFLSRMDKDEAFCREQKKFAFFVMQDCKALVESMHETQQDRNLGDLLYHNGLIVRVSNFENLYDRFHSAEN